MKVLASKPLHCGDPCFASTRDDPTENCGGRPPVSQSDQEDMVKSTPVLGEEGIWRDTMARLILKLQDGVSDGSSGKVQRQRISCTETALTGLDQTKSVEMQGLPLPQCSSSSPDHRHKQTEDTNAPITESDTSLIRGSQKECLVPAVEAAMSAVSIAQAAAARQCTKAKAAEVEAKEKERIALEKTSEAADEVARAQVLVLEAQQASAAAAHLKATEEQFAEQAAEKLSKHLAEQVEVKLAKVEMRKVELEENLADLAMKQQQEMHAAKEAAACRMRDHQQALEVALRSAERRAQNRLLDADALASNAEARAKARAKAADEEAEEAIRLAHQRVVQAERTCHVRIERGQIAEMTSEQETASIWANLMRDLPPGLEDRLFAAETYLQDHQGTHVLRRAREAHGKIRSESHPWETAAVMTWGVLLAIALDTVLQVFLCSKSGVAGSEQPSISSAKQRADLKSHEPRATDASGLQNLSLDETRAQASKQPDQERSSRDWDRVSEVSYNADVETQDQSQVVQQLYPDDVLAPMQEAPIRESNPLAGLATLQSLPGSSFTTDSCRAHSLVQLKELQQEQLRDLQNLKEMQLQVSLPHGACAFRPGDESAVLDSVQLETMDCCRGEKRSFSADLDRFRAEQPEENLPITIGEVQRSVAIDRARLQEELRTFRLQQRLRRHSSPGPVRSRTPSPQRRPLYELPDQKRPADVQRSRVLRVLRVLPADVVARLSSPALAAAAQHWGLPKATSPSPRRRPPSPTAKAASMVKSGPNPLIRAVNGQANRTNGTSGMNGVGTSYSMGMARGPFSPVRACHSLWRPGVGVSGR